MQFSKLANPDAITTKFHIPRPEPMEEISEEANTENVVSRDC